MKPQAKLVTSHGNHNKRASVALKKVQPKQKRDAKEQPRNWHKHQSLKIPLLTQKKKRSAKEQRKIVFDSLPPGKSSLGFISTAQTFNHSIIMSNNITSATTMQPELNWLTSSSLSVVVVGASGDLAKKMTFPSLLNLYDDNLLPKNIRIWGFARSNLTSPELRERLRPYLAKKGTHAPAVIDSFLECVHYQAGNSYGDQEAFKSLHTAMQAFEKETMEAVPAVQQANRLFYFAIPPNVFAETGLAIKSQAMQETTKGWTRLIVEKPFGRDLESFEVLNKTLSEHFTEDHLYRIDHYLGKELVQNLTVLRFSNIWLEKLWNADNIKCVILTFKENFGTEGRGGYFDKYVGSCFFCFCKSCVPV